MSCCRTKTGKTILILHAILTKIKPCLIYTSQTSGFIGSFSIGNISLVTRFGETGVLDKTKNGQDQKNPTIFPENIKEIKPIVLISFCAFPTDSTSMQIHHTTGLYKQKIIRFWLFISMSMADYIPLKQ